MKNAAIILLTLFVLTATSSCQQGTRVDPINEKFQSDQDVIAALINEIFTVAQSKDMDSLDSYHLNSPKFSKFDDGEVTGRQDYEMGKKTETEFFAGVAQFNFTLPDTKVDVFDDVAIATFIIAYSVTLSPGDTSVIEGKDRGTLVFAKDNNRWKITHEHFSPVVQAGQ